MFGREFSAQLSASQLPAAFQADPFFLCVRLALGSASPAAHDSSRHSQRSAYKLNKAVIIQITLFPATAKALVQRRKQLFMMTLPCRLCKAAQCRPQCPPYAVNYTSLTFHEHLLCSPLRGSHKVAIQQRSQAWSKTDAHDERILGQLRASKHSCTPEVAKLPSGRAGAFPPEYLARSSSVAVISFSVLCPPLLLGTPDAWPPAATKWGRPPARSCGSTSRRAAAATGAGRCGTQEVHSVDATCYKSLCGTPNALQKGPSSGCHARAGFTAALQPVLDLHCSICAGEPTPANRDVQRARRSAHKLLQQLIQSGVWRNGL